jgi:hypothetical protein
MSWHKVTFPLSMEIDPNVVKIGNIGWACYEKANQPAGFAMFHATRGHEIDYFEKRLVYLSPVAAELCKEEIEKEYTLEPCDVPACDEPNMIFVFGDPLVMGHLKEHFEPEPGTWEWKKIQMEAAQKEAEWAEFEAAQAEAKAAQTETAQPNGFH